MHRRVRFLSPLSIASLIAFVVSALGLVLLRSTVLACTVGFHTSGQPISIAEAGQCPTSEIESAVLVAAGLVSAGMLIWLALRLFLADSATGPETGGVQHGELTIDQASTGSLLSRLRAWPSSWWVCVLIALFFTAYFLSEALQYVHLITDGLGDLEINQQLLSSTILGGKPYPFYDTYTCTHFGECSFLQEHQAFLAYPVAFAYDVAPTPFTLFAIQSLALGLAALPLYALAVDVIGSHRLSLVVAASYLAWVPLGIAAIRDTFHWEAFIPVEMLTLFWLWNRKRYRLAVPVVLLSFATFEVNAILAVFVGLYFIWPWLVKAVRLFVHALFSGSGGLRDAPSRLRTWVRWIRKSLHVPEVYAALALMSGSAVAYILLRLFGLYGGWLLGVPPVPADMFHGTFLNADFALNLTALSFDWQSKMWFWVVIYLTLGFIPLLAPRAILLVLPWIGFTIFNVSSTFWNLNPHFFVPAAALLIGFTFGLSRLNLWASGKPAGSAVGSRTSVEPSTGITRAARRAPSSSLKPWTLVGSKGYRSPKATEILTVGLVIIVAGNLFLTPISPFASAIYSSLGPPFPSPYGVSFASTPSNQPLEQLVSLIPADAVVDATPTVFTLVADDPYAYVMAGPAYNLGVLPGNESNRLEYVLLPYDNAPIGQYLGSSLAYSLYDRSDFGVRGCVNNSAVGGVELFQRNYTGPALVFGPADSLCPNYFSGGTGLAAEPTSTVLANASSPSGVVVRSSPCAARVPFPVWTGPGIQLPPGQYDLRVVVSAYNSTAATCAKPVSPGEPLLRLNVTGQNVSGPETFYKHQILESALCSPACGGWYYLNTSFTLNAPTSDISITGSVLIGQYVSQVSYIVLSPVRS